MSLDPPTLAVVIGSRSLASRGIEAEAWARHLIHCISDHADVIVSGDAPGPDAWARERVVELHTERLRGRFYGLDGMVRDAWGTPLGRWERAERVPPPGHPERRRWPLTRNAAIVRAVALRVRRDGVRAEVYALVDPASPTRGTHHTLTLARRAGLTCHTETFEGDSRR